jgi:sugar transferase (PEP-CTERM/EpsH1 system associated)
MSEILYLAHRIPYPPNKGDKIRSWHLLEGLARRFRVHLGTFVDDPDDWQHLPVLREVCGEVCARPLSPRAARLRSLAGLATGRALTLDYYRDAQLHAWVRRLAAERPLTAVFAFSSSMAPYAEALPLRAGGRRIVDFCDVDSDKWRQYAGSHRWPLSWLYAREARLLERAETRCTDLFDTTVVVAEAEARLVRRQAPGSAHKVRVLPNGVDTAYFDPGHAFADPFAGQGPAIVFTGAMDYHPNVDGVCWFAEEILPSVRAAVPGAHFCIVGSNPAEAVRTLARRAGVSVTGRVPDVRPYLARAAAVVAPLRIARGVQNKVLEAMAMARPIVATPNAVQGIEGVTRGELAVAETAGEFAGKVVGALDAAGVACVPAAREFVAGRYAWRAQVETLAQWLDTGPRLSEGPVAGAARMSSPLLEARP